MTSIIYQTIGDRVLRFLEEALVERNVERDFSTAESILQQLLPLIPTDDDGWEQGREQVMEMAVAAFAKRPPQWGEALKLVAIYFNSIDGPGSHPHADRNVQKSRGLNQEPKYPISIELVVPFLKGLLMNAAPETRIAFFEQLADWNVLRPLTKEVLPSLTLSHDELTALLHRADIHTINDMARGMVLQPIAEWAKAHVDIAKEVVNRWLLRRDPENKLRYDAISLLVVSVSQLVSSSQMDWRNHVIQTLIHRNEEMAWNLAVWLACSAWPAGTPAETRHRDMLNHVSRLPERLVEVGLRALAQDARIAPTEAIETALSLLQMEPQATASEAKAQRALLFAGVLQGGVWANPAREFRIPPEQRDVAMQVLLDVVPQMSPSPLDDVLRSLARTEEECAREFLARWLLRHGRILRSQSRTLSEVFALLDQDQLANWLINYMINENAELRLLAMVFWPHEEGGGRDIPPDALTKIAPDAIRVLIHEWAGASVFSAAWATMLIQLGKLRLDVLGDIIPILTDEIVVNCPGTCEEGLQLYWQNNPELEEAYRQVEQQIKQRQQQWQKKDAVPELVATTESYRIYAEILNRAMQEAMADFQRSGRSIVSQIATTINIIYGSSSMTSGDQEVPFSKYKTKGMEQPQLQHLDKVGAIRLSQMHRARAAEYSNALRKAP